MPLFPEAQYLPSTSTYNTQTDRDKQAALETSFRLDSPDSAKIRCKCERSYASKKTYNKHWSGCKLNPNRACFECEICTETFNRKDVLKKHMVSDIFTTLMIQLSNAYFRTPIINPNQQPSAFLICYFFYNSYPIISFLNS